MIKPCPCGHTHCKSYIAPPLIKCACNSLKKEEALLIDAAGDLLDALMRLAPPTCPIATHHKPDCDFCRALRAVAKATKGEPNATSP